MSNQVYSFKNVNNDIVQFSNDELCTFILFHVRGGSRKLQDPQLRMPNLVICRFNLIKMNFLI